MGATKCSAPNYLHR